MPPLSRDRVGRWPQAMMRRARFDCDAVEPDDATLDATVVSSDCAFTLISAIIDSGGNESPMNSRHRDAHCNCGSTRRRAAA